MSNDSQPGPSIRRLSELARRVIHTAEAMAFDLNHPRAGLGHLALALAQEQRSATAVLLLEHGLDRQRLWHGLTTNETLLLVPVDGVRDHAMLWAYQMGSHFCGTEHLLLAVTMDEHGANVLRTCEADVVTLYHHLMAHLR